MRETAAVLLLLAFFIGCGDSGSGAAGLARGDPLLSGDGPTGDFWIDLIHSRHYSGTMLVKFRDSSDIRLHDGRLVSEVGEDVDSTNSVIDERSASFSRALSLTEDEIEAAVKSSRDRGEEFEDWNLVYRLKVGDADEAEEILRTLRDEGLVEYVHPLPRVYVSDAPTADISGDQGYLKSNAETGGLNVEAAWSAGATGNGVIVVDSEPNWNFDHEDVPIDGDDVIYAPSGGMDDFYNTSDFIQHGTAVVGIMGGLYNGLGINGISYGSVVRVAYADVTYGPIGTINTSLENYNSGISESAKLYEGDIIAIETQSIGPTTGDKQCGDPFSGCVLDEAYKTTFNSIKEATSLGIIVIEGAGNGYVNLDTPAGHIDGGPDLSNFVPGSANDSGAIVVGATMGGAHDKAIFSNCGSRVNVNAWGAGVATSGWHSSWGAKHPASDPNDSNKWYTGSFGGTSSATAIVAGAAALIQSKAKEMYGHNPPYKWVYLDSFQMRDLLMESAKATPAKPGTHPNDPIPNCNIGGQPDVGKAIQLLEDGFIIPTIKYKSQTVINGNPAKKLDVDGDGRADIIVYRNKGWHVDLSSVGPGGDNFGGDAWDLTIGMGADDPDGENDTTQPVVADYNSDGFADLALYGIKNGKWYIAYNDEALRENGTWHGWDRIVDYSADPNWKSHSRPVNGDYDGDGWMDLALQTPDGYWLIDYGDHHGEVINGEAVLSDDWDGFVDYADDPATPNADETRKGIVKYLTADQLAAAPGWAYLPVVMNGSKWNYLGYKVPDGIEDEGKIFEMFSPKFNSTIDDNPMPVFLKGNDEIPIPCKFMHTYDIGIKTSDGYFKVLYELGWGGWHDMGIDGVFGGLECDPIPADYDGDGENDRAVYCGLNEWRIAYSSNIFVNQMENGLRTIYTETPYARPFPSVIYPGGIALQEIAEHFDIWTMIPPVLPTFNGCFDYWTHWSPTGPDKINSCVH